jgi:hypothetical protein
MKTQLLSTATALLFGLAAAQVPSDLSGGFSDAIGLQISFSGNSAEGLNDGDTVMAQGSCIWFSSVLLNSSRAC